MENTVSKEKKTIDDVPLFEAQLCIKAYRDMMVNTFKLPANAILNAFTISAAELLEGLGLEPTLPTTYPAVRVYIGKQCGEKAYDMKLFLTPVGKDGKDVILTKKRDQNAPEHYVFDFNLPCPNTCDDTSPMYTLKPFDAEAR